MRAPKRDDRWHVRKRRQIVVDDRDGVAVIDPGPANVWDYGDLVRLREAAAGLISHGRRRIGIELMHVGCLPSGFMNMLCEWQERGIKVFLFNPRQNVRNMLWFHTFTEPVSATCYRVDCVGKELPRERRWDDDLGSGDEIPQACDVWTE